MTGGTPKDSALDSSEFYQSSSDESDRRYRVIRWRPELNNEIGRQLVSYAERILDGEGQRRRRRGPNQVRDREAAAEITLRSLVIIMMIFLRDGSA